VIDNSVYEKCRLLTFKSSIILNLIPSAKSQTNSSKINKTQKVSKITSCKTIVLTIDHC